MTKEEGLQIGDNNAEYLDPETAEYHKFFGIEGDRQLDDEAKERLIEKCFLRVKSLRNTELYDKYNEHHVLERSYICYEYSSLQSPRA